MVGDRVYSLVFATAAFNMWVDSSVRPKNVGRGPKPGTLGERVRSPVNDNVFGRIVKGWNYRNTVEIDGLAIPDTPFATASGFGEGVGDGCATFPLFSLPTFMSFIPALFPSPFKRIIDYENIPRSG